MKIDKFGHCIYEEQDLIELVYQDKVDLISQVYTDIVIDGLETKQIDQDIYDIEIEDYDRICQSEWLIPEEYKNFDIETWLYNQIPPWDNANIRIREELDLFKDKDMLDILRWLKYLIDTARSNNVVWGVGRGSSVSSYVLYLIGVHKIDPIKYNLDYRDFLR